MTVLYYDINNNGSTTITSLNFEFTTPPQVELHADFSTIKPGEDSNFTGTSYTITGLSLAPESSATFSIDYTCAVITGAETVYGSVDITGTSNTGSSLKVLSTTVNITCAAPPPVPATPMVIPTALECVPSTGLVNVLDNVAWYSVTIDSMTSLTFDTEGSDSGSDTMIGVYDSSGNLLGYNDDGGTGTLSSLTLKNLLPGTYYIGVGLYFINWGATDFAAVGDNSLSDDCTLKVNVSIDLTPSPPEIAIPLSIPTALECVPAAELTNVISNVAWYSITLASITTVTFDTIGSNPGSDTMIGVYDSIGVLLGYDDDSGGGGTSLLTLTNLDPGTYYIGAGFYSIAWGATGFSAAGDTPLADDCALKVNVST